MDPGRTGRTTIGRTLRPTISTAIVNTGRTGRTTVSGTLRPTISTTVMDPGCTGRTTVSGTLRPTISTTVVNTGRTGRTTVGRALLPVRILFGVGHDSSWKSRGWDPAPRSDPDHQTKAIPCTGTTPKQRTATGRKPRFGQENFADSGPMDCSKHCRESRKPGASP